MTSSEETYRDYVRGQVHSLTETLTRVMFGDFETVARTTEPDELFGYLASMINVAINSARNAQAELAASHGALADQHAMLRGIVEGTSEFVFLKDRDGRYLTINQAAADFLGLGPEAIIGRTDAQLFDEVWASRVMAQDRIVVDSGRAETFETPYEKPDGQRTLLTVKTPYLDGEGKIVGVIGMARDITNRVRAEEERKHLEDQLRHSQKMEAIGHLAGGIAHDFNNLLTGIVGFADALEEQLEGPQKESIQQILKAAQQAGELTDQLLTFSRKRITTPRTVDLDEAIENHGALLRRLIGEDIELVIQRAGEPAPVRIDPIQLEQVVVNIAVNAQDAMPEGGRLTFRVRLDEISASRPGPAEMEPGPVVVLEARDTGGGMDEETASRVFEPFFTTKAPGQGTGLGLSTVYGIVKQAGGHIEVDTAPRHGATFVVTLPRTAERSTTSASPAPVGESLAGTERVLLVEDARDIRLLMTDSLRRHGYRVVTAEDGRDALKQVERRSEPFDILVTDVVMPGLGGSDLARRMAERYPELKTLYISGYARGDILGEDIENADTAFVQKPFRPRELLGAIRALLDG